MVSMDDAHLSMAGTTAIVAAGQVGVRPEHAAAGSGPMTDPGTGGDAGEAQLNGDGGQPGAAEAAVPAPKRKQIRQGGGKGRKRRRTGATPVTRGAATREPGAGAEEGRSGFGDSPGDDGECGSDGECGIVVASRHGSIVPAPPAVPGPSSLDSSGSKRLSPALDTPSSGQVGTTAPGPHGAAPEPCVDADAAGGGQGTAGKSAAEVALLQAVVTVRRAPLKCGAEGPQLPALAAPLPLVPPSPRALATTPPASVRKCKLEGGERQPAAAMDRGAAERCVVKVEADLKDTAAGGVAAPRAHPAQPTTTSAQGAGLTGAAGAGGVAPPLGLAAGGGGGCKTFVGSAGGPCRQCDALQGHLRHARDEAAALADALVAQARQVQEVELAMKAALVQARRVAATYLERAAQAEAKLSKVQAAEDGARQAAAAAEARAARAEGEVTAVRAQLEEVRRRAEEGERRAAAQQQELRSAGQGMAARVASMESECVAEREARRAAERAEREVREELEGLRRRHALLEVEAMVRAGAEAKLEAAEARVAAAEAQLAAYEREASPCAAASPLPQQQQQSFPPSAQPLQRPFASAARSTLPPHMRMLQQDLQQSLFSVANVSNCVSKPAAVPLQPPPPPPPGPSPLQRIQMLPPGCDGPQQSLLHMGGTVGPSTSNPQALALAVQQAPSSAACRSSTMDEPQCTNLMGGPTLARLYGQPQQQQSLSWLMGAASSAVVAGMAPAPSAAGACPQWGAPVLQGHAAARAPLEPWWHPPPPPPPPPPR